MKRTKIKIPKEARSNGSRYLESMRKIASENPNIEGLKTEIESLASYITVTMNATANGQRRAAYELAKAACNNLCHNVAQGEYAGVMDFDRRMRLYYLALGLWCVALANSISGCSQIEESDRYVSVYSGTDSATIVNIVGRNSSLDLEAEFVSGMEIEDGTDFAVIKEDLTLIARDPKKFIAELPKYFDEFVEGLMISNGYEGIGIYEESTGQKAP